MPANFTVKFAYGLRRLQMFDGDGRIPYHSQSGRAYPAAEFTILVRFDRVIEPSNAFEDGARHPCVASGHPRQISLFLARQIAVPHASDPSGIFGNSKMCPNDPNILLKQ